ncbi:MAG: dihydrolipoyl dehydrogenase [Candidatus Macondimonas sp.]
MAKSFDVVVIGAGPAGYVAAIRCAQLGLKTACIDNWIGDEGKPSLGGTCLNVGCIPSKALLESSERYHQIKSGLAEHGILTTGVKLDLAAMQARKTKIVGALTQGIAGLFKTNRITALTGKGQLLETGQVGFTPHGAEQQEVITAQHIILAPGSRPVSLGAAPLDGDLVVDSSGALAFAEVPKRLGIIGAGVIGLELGSVWRRLGSEVVLLEAQQEFLSMADGDLAAQALKIFTQQGLDIRLGCRVTGVKTARRQVQVAYQDAENQTQELKVDRLVVAVGRRPNTDGLAVAGARLQLDEKGYVDIDEHCRTNLPNVYAIGDVVRGPMLAHKGSEEGVAVAERIAGQPGHVDYDLIPSVLYTHPEMAWVGRSESALKAAGADYRVGSFPFAASGRALAVGESQGLVKILADTRSDRILGVHILGPGASELIAEAVVAMSFGASSEDLARTVHAHPTLSEAVHEAALAVDKRAIHMRNR